MNLKQLVTQVLERLILDKLELVVNHHLRNLRVLLQSVKRMNNQLNQLFRNLNSNHKNNKLNRTILLKNLFNWVRNFNNRNYNKIYNHHHRHLLKSMIILKKLLIFFPNRRLNQKNKLNNQTIILDQMESLRRFLTIPHQIILMLVLMIQKSNNGNRSAQNLKKSLIKFKMKIST